MDAEETKLVGAAVTVVVCDRSRYANNMVSQFGLSLLVDCAFSDGASRRILFDTGWDGNILLRNLGQLSVPVGSIDTVVLSHAHYDHTGGLAELIQHDDADFRLIAHPQVTRKVVSTGSELKFIGLDPPDVLKELSSGDVLLVQDPVQMLPGAWTTGTIPRQTEFEKPEEDVYILTQEGSMVPDPELDDMALLLQVEDCGVVVLTGCSHAGVVNTVMQAEQVTQTAELAGVIGGFHLLDKDMPTQKKTVKKLTESNIGRIYSGHCTGLSAEQMLDEAFGDSSFRFFTGDRMLFGSKSEEICDNGKGYILQ